MVGLDLDGSALEADSHSLELATETVYFPGHPGGKLSGGVEDGFVGDCNLNSLAEGIR